MSSLRKACKGAILLFISSLFLSLSLASAEEWLEVTNHDGVTIEVEILGIQGAEVDLRVRNGQRFQIPIQSLQEESQSRIQAWYDDQLAREINPINEALGLELFDGSLLWERSSEEKAQAINWPRESQTSVQDSFRTYPMGALKVFGEPVFSAVLHGQNGKVESISLVFINRADAPGLLSSQMQSAIREAAERIRSRLDTLFGPGENMRMGTDSRVREFVQRWDWKGHTFLLSEQPGDYLSLRIVQPELADAGGQADRIRASELRGIIESRVINDAHGGVLLRDLPMVDQGPKGYCVPASFERILRYYGIPADMYLFGIASQSQHGGTYIHAAIEGLERHIRRYGRRLREISLDNLRHRDIARYIDRGVPIIWFMSSHPEFNRLATIYTEVREKVLSGEADDDDADLYNRAKLALEALRRDPLAPHACIIVGYNRDRNEVAFSDSWGPFAELRWIPLQAAQAVHMDGILVIDL